MMDKLRALIAEKGGVWPSALVALRILRCEGPKGIAQRLRSLKTVPEWVLMFDDPPEANTLAFMNDVIPRRGAVLMSDWHRGLIAARRLGDQAASALPEITITAVTHNSARWLPGFFASISRLDYPAGRIRVVVVDCASTDTTIKLLDAFAAQPPSVVSGVKILRRKNLGFGRGQNEAIDAAATKLVLVTNVDVSFPPGAVAAAVQAALADHPQVAAWELRQQPFEHPKYFDPVTLEAAWQSCACVLMRRSAFIDVGGFDPTIFMYGEDVELSYRLRGAGYQLRYLPWVTLTHHVEFGDTKTRPLQLGSSLAANILLRSRYGTPAAARCAQAALTELRANEMDPARREGMDNALRLIKNNRRHFEKSFPPRKAAPFPFEAFDYTRVREGYTVPLAPADASTPDLPLVSIITRTHGPQVGPLREAITCVLNQVYPRIEHVVVEDRGTYAEALVNTVRDAYGTDIRYVASEGKGRSAAANTGLRAARGEVILFLDNDDLLFPDHVEALVQALQANPGTAAAYAMSWEALTDTTPDGTSRVCALMEHEAFRLAFSRQRLRQLNFIPIQALAFRRTTYERAGGLDETIDHLEDWHLWNRFAAIGDFVQVKRLTSIYVTPADLKCRAARQASLDMAYEPVKEKIKKALRE